MYTAWWQKQVGESGLTKAVLDSTVGETRTRDLLILRLVLKPLDWPSHVTRL